jgi:hypothetical protein
MDASILSSSIVSSECGEYFMGTVRYILKVFITLIVSALFLLTDLTNHGITAGIDKCLVAKHWQKY